MRMHANEPAPESPDQDPHDHEHHPPAFDPPPLVEELCTNFASSRVDLSDPISAQPQNGETSANNFPPESISTWSLKRLASSLTSPAFFGGLGMTLVSTPYSMWTTAAYAISTGVSIYNDLRASPSNGSERATTDQQARGLFSRLLHSPGFIYGVSGVVALAQGSSLLAQGNPLTAFAYGCVCVGSLALAALVNRQAGYAALMEDESFIGRALSFANKLTPTPFCAYLKNPVVTLAAANILFSAGAPGAMSNLSQTLALGVGACFGVLGIVRATALSTTALKQSLMLGAMANLSLALNAGLGGGFFTATALTLWSAQNISAYLREE